ncbi:hypothetical protein HK102_001623 [Quaeritorhiza haematococci]|nr:hypothetical protein HK102_001623 [Quaeritorhiza haematococci]
MANHMFISGQIGLIPASMVLPDPAAIMQSIAASTDTSTRTPTHDEMEDVEEMVSLLAEICVSLKNLGRVVEGAVNRECTITFSSKQTRGGEDDNEEDEDDDDEENEADSEEKDDVLLVPHFPAGKIAGCVCYVSSPSYVDIAKAEWEAVVKDVKEGGESERGERGEIPVCFVSVSRLPRNAKVEWQAVVFDGEDGRDNNKDEDDEDDDEDAEDEEDIKRQMSSSKTYHTRKYNVGSTAGARYVVKARAQGSFAVLCGDIIPSASSPISLSAPHAHAHAHAPSLNVNLTEQDITTMIKEFWETVHESLLDLSEAAQTQQGRNREGGGGRREGGGGSSSGSMWEGCFSIRLFYWSGIPRVWVERGKSATSNSGNLHASVFYAFVGGVFLRANAFLCVFICE